MNTASARLPPQIFQDFTIRHPIQYYLLWVGYGTEALDNIWVLQTHPNGDFLVKHLATANFVNVLITREGM